MTRHGGNPTDTRVARQLTQREIATRIRALTETVLATDDDDSTGPRWIEPADLVHRMQPFLGRN